MKKENRRQAFFGVKCLLLAVAIILIAGTVILSYTAPDLLPGWAITAVHILAMIIIAVVMVFEIKPYVELTNTGIRSIYREKEIEIENFGKFNKMVSENTFRYHFQPIVDAKNGSIFAYEALMRSPEDVGLNPREILKYAEISQKLYSIEYYTFYNTLRIYHEDPQKFAGRKMFINSIPSVTLSAEDLDRIHREFGDITQNTVVEILEDDEDTEESCVYFEKLRELFGCKIAIDDYGSGYAGEMKLLNNNPNFIKIDISLIRSIDSDMKKQLLFSNIMKFASKYDIMVLAEGVETKEELGTLIELGVDLVQGFYCARPNAEIVPEISAEAKDFIIEQNIRLSQFDNDRKIYNAADGETISLVDLAVQKYGKIHLERGTMTIIGEPKHSIDMLLSTGKGESCTINLEHVNITAVDGACVRVGAKGELTLNLSGDCAFNKEGILVPGSSSLRICGDGSLSINISRNKGIGIGSVCTDEFGSITVDTGGSITVSGSGDKTICIGGGSQAEGSSVRFVRGTIEVFGKGIQTIGVGCVSGSFCFMNSASLKVEVGGNEVVGVGCINGFVNIETTGGDITVAAEGDRVTGVGSHSGENGKIVLSEGTVDSHARGKDVICIGTLDGSIELLCSAHYVRTFGEGTSATGIGSGSGEGTLTITGGTVNVIILAATPRWFGNTGSNMIITGGNVVFNDMTYPMEAVNAFGENVVKRTIDGDSFEKHITGEKGSYLYRAAKIPEVDCLQVFLPEECTV